MNRYTLVYDSGCGPCARFRSCVEFLDVGRRICYLGLDDADRTGRLDRVPPARRHRSFHLVSAEGRTWSGAEALPPLAELLPAGKLLSSALAGCPPVTFLANFAYSALSRLHDSASCGYRPELPSA